MTHRQNVLFYRASQPYMWRCATDTTVRCNLWAGSR